MVDNFHITTLNVANNRGIPQASIDAIQCKCDFNSAEQRRRLAATRASSPSFSSPPQKPSLAEIAANKTLPDFLQNRVDEVRMLKMQKMMDTMLLAAQEETAAAYAGDKYDNNNKSLSSFTLAEIAAAKEEHILGDEAEREYNGFFEKRRPSAGHMKTSHHQNHAAKREMATPKVSSLMSSLQPNGRNHTDESSVSYTSTTESPSPTNGMHYTIPTPITPAQQQQRRSTPSPSLYHRDSRVATRIATRVATQVATPVYSRTSTPTRPQRVEQPTISYEDEESTSVSLSTPSRFVFTAPLTPRHPQPTHRMSSTSSVNQVRPVAVSLSRVSPSPHRKVPLHENRSQPPGNDHNNHAHAHHEPHLWATTSHQKSHSQFATDSNYVIKPNPYPNPNPKFASPIPTILTNGSLSEAARLPRDPLVVKSVLSSRRNPVRFDGTGPTSVSLPSPPPPPPRQAVPLSRPRTPSSPPPSTHIRLNHLS